MGIMVVMGGRADTPNKERIMLTTMLSVIVCRIIATADLCNTGLANS
jgi:hypothetical protein